MPESDKNSVTFSQKIREQVIRSYAYLRSGVFLYQNLSLPLIDFLITGKNRFKKEFPDHLQIILKDLKELLEKDAAYIAEGKFPISVLKPESVPQFLIRYPKILLDGAQVSTRRKQRKNHDFNSESQAYAEGLPEYYTRNFHYQTDGYLSSHSAELYEHQVEILFAGAADPMRRLVLPLLKDRISSQGEGLHFLELGAGTGRLSRFVKLCFPKARITLLDLSDPYLDKAKQRLADLDRINFIQGDAAHLPFQDEQFDLVYSCFLFHELPLDVRKKVFAESARVLKKQGYLGVIDSVQSQDKPELLWALEQFPVDFHEPFFKNYLQHPIESLIEAAAFANIESRIGFLSKAWVAQKS